MRVLVCGGRDYDDYDRLEDELNLLERAYGSLTIISGCAKGADTLAIRYAEEHGDNLVRFPAQWRRYGNRAGPIRNKQMLTEGKPDIVVAFPGGTGTAHMVRISKEANVEVIEVES